MAKQTAFGDCTLAVAVPLKGYQLDLATLAVDYVLDYAAAISVFRALI